MHAFLCFLNFWVLNHTALLSLFVHISIVSSNHSIISNAVGSDFVAMAYPLLPAFIVIHALVLKTRFWSNFFELVARSTESIIIMYWATKMSILVITQGEGRQINTFYAFLVCLYILAICEIVCLIILAWGLVTSRRIFRSNTVREKLRNSKQYMPLFSKRFKSEKKIETRLRGVLAKSLLFIFELVVLYVLVIQPLQDPTRLKIQDSPLVEDTWTSVLNVGAYEPWTFLVESPYDAQSIVDSTTISTSTIPAFEGPGGARRTDICQPLPDVQGLVQFHCNVPALTDTNVAPSLSAHTILIVTANFTNLRESQSDYAKNQTEGAIKLTVGMAKQVEDILEGTAPFLIFPGSNLLSTISLSLRQRIGNLALGTFGIKQYRTFPVAHIDTVFPDPTPPIRGPEISTLRIFIPGRDPKYARYTLTQDIEQSIMTGISSVGGLWTIINGIFMIVFGCSLLLVSFGIKPLSIYGLIHLFRKDKAALSEGMSMSGEEQAHTVAILRQHLLDIPDLKSGGSGSSDAVHDGSQERLVSEHPIEQEQKLSSHFQASV